MSEKVRAATGMESAPLQSGAVLFNPKSGKFVMLNASAAFLWGELAGMPADADELAGRLCDEFDGVDPPTALKDTHDAIAHLRKLELVVPADD